MNTVQEIEKAITQLPKDNLTVLREWFEEFEAKMWDERFEEDVQSGKLEKLANEAIADFTNPKHPSLHRKKVGNYWSAKVGRKHRTVGVVSALLF